MVSVIVRFVKDTFLHLYDHTIKPILTYGSEIWGMFSVDSSSCWKKSDYCFEICFSTSQTEQSHVKKLKYFLGVNRKTTNIAVMSELGRYPIYFSVILALLKYCHRLEGQQVYYLMLIYVIKSYILVKSIHSIRVYYV
jgi:hypothetical protein